MDNQIQKGILENIDIQQLQGEIAKLNPGVLRGTDGGSLHFITIPRSAEQEYIDHSLLNPEFLTHSQNGVLVDLLQSQANYLPHIQNHTIVNRQFLNEIDLMAHIPMHTTETANVIVNDSDNKVAQAFLQYVQKNGQIPSSQNQQTISTNETQVIVSNKINQIQHPSSLVKMIKNQVIVGHQNSSLLDQDQQIFKLEMELEDKDFLDESDSDNESTLSATVAHKTILPHKKRISTKLKSSSCNDDDRDLDTNDISSVRTASSSASSSLNNAYKCELCGLGSENQLVFFTHLKQHYEPITEIVKTEYTTNVKEINHQTYLQPETQINCQINCSTDISRTAQHINCQAIGLNSDQSNANENEFSDTEDMLEGIRGVVDKVQESVDHDLGLEPNNMKSWDMSNSCEKIIVYNESSSGVSNSASIEQTENDLILYYNQDKSSNSLDDFKHNITPNPSILRQQLLKFPIEKYTEIEKYHHQDMESKPNDELIMATKLSLKDFDLEFTEEITEISDTETGGGKTKRKKKLKTFKCNECSKVCNSKNALHYHFLSHTGERPHQCEVCGKSFFAGSALKVHKRLHSGDKPYNCNFCDRAFRQWGDLKYHITSLHSEEKNHQCEFCGKDFARRYSLVIHRRIHTGERNYKCEYCNKTFRASSYLQDHRRIHTGEKPHICNVCPKKFRVRGDLNRHLKIHMRNKTTKVNNKQSSIKTTNNGGIKSEPIASINVKYEDSLDIIYPNDHREQSCINNERLTEHLISKNNKTNSKKKPSLKDKIKDEILFIPSTMADVNMVLRNNKHYDEEKHNDRSDAGSTTNNDNCLENGSTTAIEVVQEVGNTNRNNNNSWSTIDVGKLDNTELFETQSAAILTTQNLNGTGRQQFVVWPVDMTYMS